MLVYLAQPIDQAGNRNTTNAIRRLREAAGQLVGELGLSVFQPASAYQIESHPHPSGYDLLVVDRINRAALEQAGALVAVLPLGVPTLGTPSEIEWALNSNRPVVIITNTELRRASVQLMNWQSRGALVLDIDHEANFLQPEQVAGARYTLFNPNADRMPRTVTPTLPYVMAAMAAAPSKAYSDDAGFDLTVAAEVGIEPGGSALVPSGLSFAIPDGHWGLVIGRSSAWSKRGLVVHPSVIDAGWRGELFVRAWNPGTEPVKVLEGERLGQLVILPVWPGTPVEVTELPPHDRGTNGFGSSGR